MATKTIVIGLEKNEEHLNDITFEYILDKDANSFFNIEFNSHLPKFYNYIELICRDFDGIGGDLMFAYNDPHNRQSGELIIGQWNDGIVT